MLNAQQAAKSKMAIYWINGVPDELDEWSIMTMESLAYQWGCDTDEVLRRVFQAKKQQLAKPVPAMRRTPKPATTTILINGKPEEFDAWTVTVMQALAYREGSTVEVMLNQLLERWLNGEIEIEGDTGTMH